MRKKIGLALVALLIAALVTHRMWLASFGEFLTLKDNFKKADAIIVLSGFGRFERADLAALIYHKGFAPKILRILEKDSTKIDTVISTFDLDADQREFFTRYLWKKGVPKEAIIIGPEVATSTYDELMAARELINAHGFKSIILVTSNYHARRTLMTANYVFRGMGLDLYHATAFSSDRHPKIWWRYEDDIKDIIVEACAMVYYITYHFFIEHLPCCKKAV
ncbi:MAG: YdcF family protein, partial [Candidatus Omnitrophota bacterium]